MLGLFAAVSLAGREMAPLYAPPVVALPSQFSDVSSQISDVSSQSGGTIAPRGDWWRIFLDMRLNALEADLDAVNPDLAAAYATYQDALARAEQAQAGQFPEIDFGGDLSADKQSTNLPLRSILQPNYFGANEAFAGIAGFVLGVWGRVADIVIAAIANSEASGYALADTRLLLHAELTREYVALRGLDAQAKLYADTLNLYQSALELTQQRLNAKISPPIDAERAKTQVESVKAQASDLALRRTALADAIATLAGKSAAGYRLAVHAAPMVYPRRPRAAPGELLRRRPDVAAAEREVAAASSLVGAAIANKYSRFTIGFQTGTQDTSLRLLDPVNSLYSIGPSMTVPLFDAGLRDAEIKQARADAELAAQRYRSVGLNAVRKVQDYVSAPRWLADEPKQSDAAAKAARRALDMSMALYRDGAAFYLNVVTAQDSALVAQRVAIGLRTRELDAYVGLILSLGGGWSGPGEAEVDTVAAAVP